ncbi:hypothetical protein RFI_01560 [Reticulomyxa filosa]|uniref:Uncharacterized protein n=1 Tax=Reticulomyxa filosa TaxID=46433 RepID=X6PBK8_RETFI|nr:hypothetical protein RFI_01560 [Reticulomyxa filosa]|eukprot:ETO35503.1 hypothetical protein RFI_01560 [Reticulomyxa filosa]
MLTRKQPDSGLTDNVIKKSKLQSKEVTFENVWKKNMKVQHSNDCSHKYQIQRTRISDSVIKLLGLNVLSRKILAHTFSGNFRTLFVHFAVDVNDQQPSQLAHNFNSKNVQIEQKDNSNDNQRIVKHTRCDIYRKIFATEQKKKREEAVINLNS